jgi:molybdate transport system substrate-binding protein
MAEHISNVRVVTSNATLALLGALVRAFERARPQYTVALEADSAKSMLARIENGERADVAVLNAPHVQALANAGILDEATRRPFTRSRIGVAVRAGTPHPDIATVDAFRQMLLDARSIAHTVHGASGMYVPWLIESLGLTAQVGPKIVTRAGGLIGRLVASGEAQIAIQQISELLAVDGIDLVGPLPDDIQMTFESAVALFTACPNEEGSVAFVRFLWSPGAAALYEAHGLERL